MEHRVVQRPVAEISAVAPTQQILVLMLFFLMNVVLAKVGQGISLSISEVGPAAMGDASDPFLDLGGQKSANKPSVQAIFTNFTMAMATRTQKIDF